MGFERRKVLFSSYKRMIGCGYEIKIWDRNSGVVPFLEEM